MFSKQAPPGVTGESHRSIWHFSDRGPSFQRNASGIRHGFKTFFREE